MLTTIQMDAELWDMFKEALPQGTDRSKAIRAYIKSVVYGSQKTAEKDKVQMSLIELKKKKAEIEYEEKRVLHDLGIIEELEKQQSEKEQKSIKEQQDEEMSCVVCGGKCFNNPNSKRVFNNRWVHQDCWRTTPASEYEKLKKEYSD